MEEQNKTEIIPVPVQPLVTPDQAAKAWKLFLKLKEKLLNEDDYQPIAGKKFIKKSGFRKIAVAFNLSDRILESERVDREDGSFFWRIMVEVEADNGRKSTGVGICDSKERKFAHVEHDVFATCHTRAKNRAISDMVAGGVVSAEEMEASVKKTPQTESKDILSDVILKDGWNWDRVMREFMEDIQAKQKELGENIVSFESAAVIVAREKGITKELVSDFEGATPDHETNTIADAIESVGSDIKNGDLEISVEDGKTKVRPTKFLATHIWNSLNAALWKAGLSWTKDGDKRGYWSGVVE